MSVGIYFSRKLPLTVAGFNCEIVGRKKSLCFSSAIIALLKQKRQGEGDAPEYDVRYFPIENEILWGFSTLIFVTLFYIVSKAVIAP